MSEDSTSEIDTAISLSYDWYCSFRAVVVLQYHS